MINISFIPHCNMLCPNHLTLSNISFGHYGHSRVHQIAQSLVKLSALGLLAFLPCQLATGGVESSEIIGHGDRLEAKWANEEKIICRFQIGDQCNVRMDGLRNLATYHACQPYLTRNLSCLLAFRLYNCLRIHMPFCVAYHQSLDQLTN